MEVVVIKVREKIKLGNIWYALGAHGDCNAVVIVEEGSTAQYFFSSNSGKTFADMGSREGSERSVLTVKWPGGAKPKYDSIADVRFFGQSPAQRECTELKRHLTTFGIS